MIRSILRGVLVTWLVALEVVVLARGRAPVPDPSALLVVFCALELRGARALHLLLPLAGARALLQPGAFVWHLWLLLAAWAVLLPLRRQLIQERWQMQMLCGAIAGALLAWLPAAVLGVGTALGRGPLDLLLTSAVTPGALLVLGWLCGDLEPRSRRRPAARDWVATPRRRGGREVQA